MKDYALLVEYSGRPNELLDRGITAVANLGAPDSGFWLDPPIRDLCFYANTDKQAAEDAKFRVLAQFPDLKVEVSEKDVE